MAHEKLRFSLIINDDRKVSTDNKEELHQAVYSDDYLDTHYGLFAKFIGKKSTEDDKRTRFDCTKVVVQLQNYNGNLTVGIYKVLGIIPKDKDESLEIEGSTGKQYYLVVAIQGLNNSFKGDKECDVCFYDGDIIETVIVQTPIENKYSQIDEEDADVRNKNCLFIDGNFQYRDGESIEWRPGAKKRIETIRTLIDEGLDEGLKKVLDENTLFTKDLDESISQKDFVFTTIGGGRACKMKISDVRIR